MDLSKVTSVINATDWSKASDISLTLNPVNTNFGNIIMWGDYIDTQKTIDISFKSISIPQYTAKLIEELVGGVYHQSRGVDELFELQITFRDFNSMSLYRRFVNAFIYANGNYSDNTLFKIEVFCGGKQSKNLAILSTNKAYLTAVSQLELSQENNEVVEFNVSFKFILPNHDNSDIKNINIENVIKSDNNNTVETINNFFSKAITNGLSSAQNAIATKFDNFLKDW